ncbi:CarD family transcriptional regulator [Sporomusa sp.]|jgi:CarD family transcriptional regulator|uniref:CarD family transcriptional regulator n=1 Tax=Sporomusa sp. TaxID=2078658 RepID=UPI002C932ABB|nr:CarD family transcriptional regulator [Sporomusa sp.]MDF2875292.1 CarD family transcriptional regulator [Sporomusa sp.]HWR07970.1 CarD family transcriptional regulator [Sporomusa sp.]
MFQVGDKIFYPTQGGCVIQAVEEKVVHGETLRYCTVNILHRKMTVRFPTSNSDRLGIRPIVDPKELDNVLNTFYDGESDTTVRDNRRIQRNISKIKSGDIYEGAEVIRDLVRSNNKKKLGLTEKNMMENALEILISEVVLVKGITKQQASTLLDQVINMPLSNISLANDAPLV